MRIEIHTDGESPDFGRPWVLGFGAFGPVRVLVWAEHLQDALDEACDYLAEHAPGFFDADEPEFPEDHMWTSHGWLPSWEWRICRAAESFSPAETVGAACAFHAACDLRRDTQHIHDMCEALGEAHTAYDAPDAHTA